MRFWLYCRFLGPSKRLPSVSVWVEPGESACWARCSAVVAHTPRQEPLIWPMRAPTAGFSCSSSRLAGMPKAPGQLAQTLFPGGKVQGSQSLILLQSLLNWKFRDTSWAVSPWFHCLLFLILNLIQSSVSACWFRFGYGWWATENTRHFYLQLYWCALRLLSVYLG